MNEKTSLYNIGIRNMKNKKYSLVLGGGAARGLAHIGVIKRIDELGNTPACIVGTSMGALVWAFYACGYTSDEIAQVASDVSLIKLLDIDLKKWGIKWKKLMKYFDKFFWDKTFADTVIPLKIIATNIDTWEKTVFTEWKILDAIRASISIPWVFAPYVYKWSHYIDGGVTANLAIEDALPWLPVIAVSVQIQEFLDSTGGMSSLFTEGFFSTTYQVLRKTIQLMMLQNEEQSRACNTQALVIQVGRDDIEYYNFNRVDELIDEWYRLSENIEHYLQNYESK